MDGKCREIQSKTELFLADKLHGAERQEFVSHVKNCKSCRDELEFYHVIYSVVDHLDNESASGSSDYIASLERKLGIVDTKDKWWNKHRIIFGITLLAVIGGIVAVLIVLL